MKLSLADHCTIKAQRSIGFLACGQTTPALKRQTLLLTILALAIAVMFTSLGTHAVQSAEPTEGFTVAVYQLGPMALTATTDHGERIATKRVPDSGASEADIIEWMKWNHAVVAGYFKEQGLELGKGSLAVYDSAVGTLVVRALPEVHVMVEALTSRLCCDSMPAEVQWQLDIVEAPTASAIAALSRGVVADATKVRDELEIKGRLVKMLAGQGKPGTRQTESSGNSQEMVESYDPDAKDGLRIVKRLTDTGTKVEIDPVISADHETIDLNIAVEHNYAPPTSRVEDGLELHARHLFKATTSIVARSGSTTLLGVWKPSEVSDVMQTAFINVGVVQTDLNREATSPAPELMKKYGDVIVPTPKITEDNPEDVPAGMIRRSFSIPPDFLSRGGDNQSADPNNPFTSSTLIARLSARGILEEEGVVFPPGASASFLPTTSRLVVVNTPDEMKQVEAFVSALTSSPPNQSAITAYVIQGPTKLMRTWQAQTFGSSDHSVTWSAMETAIEKGDVSLLDATLLVTKPGTRATSEAGLEYRSARHPASSADEKTKASSRIVYEAAIAGFTLEADLVIGADGHSIDINFAAAYAMDAPRSKAQVNASNAQSVPLSEFSKHSITTSMTLMNGIPRIASVWTPTSQDGKNKDVLQALVFIPKIVTIEPAKESAQK